MTTGKRSSDPLSLLLTALIVGSISGLIILVIVLTSWHTQKISMLKTKVFSMETERDGFKQKFENCKDQLGVFYRDPKLDKP